MISKMDNYKLLIEKYIKGNLSDSEKTNLKHWLSEKKNNKLIFKDEIKKWYKKDQQNVKVDSTNAFHKVNEAINEQKTKNSVVKTAAPYFKYAAVVIGIIICVSAFTLLKNSEKNTNSQIVTNKKTDHIIITKSDGSSIYVNPNSSENSIVSNKGEIIGKKENELLVIGSKKGSVNDQFMTVQIPKGKSFKMMLSDKTIVQLNAESSLTFPENFLSSQKQRIVSLKGEAFFHVSTNKKQPFIVKTDEINIEVLGTQFNVSSYNNDASIKTTLVECSVKITDQKNQLTLVPGHQAVFDKKNKILNQKKVNIASHISWLNNQITLNNESFANFSKKIERAYNVNITCSNKQLNTTRFTGTFNIDNEKIEDVLLVFSETTSFNYTITDNNIIIK